MSKSNTKGPALADMSQSELDHALIKAIEAKQLDKIVDIINAGANVDLEIEEERTIKRTIEKPLPAPEDGSAAATPHATITETVEEKITVVKDVPLTIAVRKAARDVIEKLVNEGGANINAKIENGITCLHLAIEVLPDKQMREIIECLIKLEIDLNAADEHGVTAVSLAIQNCKTDIARILLDAGAQFNFNARNAQGRILLHHAAVEGNIKLLGCLLDLGRPIAQKDAAGMNVLHHAASNSRKDVIDFLLKREEGATLLHINEEDAEGRTCLEICFDKGEWDMVKYLISKGADIHHVSSRDGMALLHRKVFEGRKDLVEKLVEYKVQIDCRDRDENTALHWAASSGNVDIASYLLSKKAEHAAKNKTGNTPLHRAAYWGRMEVLSMLLDLKGCDPNVLNVKKRTALHEAASQGRRDAIAKLIEKNANIEIEDCEGHTPLQVAFDNSKLDCIQLLIEKGAAVERTQKCYGTLLHHAIAHSWADIVEALVRSHADVNKPDPAGRSPLYNATERNNFQMVKCLTQNGAHRDPVDPVDGRTPLHQACLHNNYEIAEWLVATCRHSVHIKDKKGKRPLHYAVAMGSSKISNLLLDHGAEVNGLDDDGRSLLMVACEHNQISIANDLIATYGADVNQTEPVNGFTALHIAVISGSKECCETLILNGATLTLKDNFGRTPLILASQCGQTECGRLLVQKFGAQKQQQQQQQQQRQLQQQPQ